MLGLKVGRFGTLDSSIFVVSGADVGQATADAFVNCLKRDGWRTSVIRSGALSDTEVIISGEIVEFSVNARSAWFSTNVAAKVILILEAENRADGSKIRMTVRADDSRKVFWFSAHYAPALNNETLVKCYATWASGTKVEGRSVRLN
jgi:hypothetical protein